MVLLIATEATLFLLLRRELLLSPRRDRGPWPPAPHCRPEDPRAAAREAVLVAGSVADVARQPFGPSAERDASAIGLVAALVLRRRVPRLPGDPGRRLARVFRPQDDAYSSIYYTLIGVHYVHAWSACCSPRWALLRSRRFTPAASDAAGNGPLLALRQRHRRGRLPDPLHRPTRMTAVTRIASPGRRAWVRPARPAGGVGGAADRRLQLREAACGRPDCEPLGAGATR